MTQNTATQPRHLRTFGESDGIVTDDVAIAWSDLEDANRRAGTEGKHRR